MSNSKPDNEGAVDPRRASRMMRNILKLEETNNKTKTLSDKEMVRKIAKMIEDDVNCYSNQ